MFWLFLAVFFVGLFAFAPGAAVRLGVWLTVMTVTVGMLGRWLAGDVSFAATAKAVVMASLLPIVFVLALLSFSHSTGIQQIGVTGSLLVLGLLAASFLLVFRFTLGTDTRVNAILAAVSVVLGAGLWLGLRAFA